MSGERERERKRDPWQGVIDGGVGPPEANLEIMVTTLSSSLKWAWPHQALELRPSCLSRRGQ